MFGLLPHWTERREGGLTRTEYTPFDLLHREFASLFDRAFGGWPVPFETGWDYVPAYGIEMEEKDGAVVVCAEVPGFEASELDIQVTGDVLTIVAVHKEEPPKEEGAKPVERRYGWFERTVTLPPGVVPDKAEACYRNGVLEVRLPLAPEVQPKRIAVKV
jgi:HSP20 family protein